MLSAVIVKVEFGMYTKRILKEGTNVEKFGCFILYGDKVSVIPFNMAFLNGNIIEEETQLFSDDILSFANTTVFVHQNYIEEIDLTDDMGGDLHADLIIDLTGGEESTNNLVSMSPNYPPTSPNYDSSSGQYTPTQPRTPNYETYSEPSEESMDLDNTTFSSDEDFF